MENDDTPRDPVHFVKIVGGEHHRTPLCSEFCEYVTYHLASVEIETGSRLVEERDVRFGGERKCKRETLSFTPGQASPRVLRAMGEPEAVEESIRIDPPVVEPAVVANERSHTCTGSDAAVLQHHSHPRGNGVGCAAGVVPEDADRSRGRATQSLATLDRRCLPRTVATEQRRDFTVPGTERDAVHRGGIAVANDECVDHHRIAGHRHDGNDTT